LPTAPPEWTRVPPADKPSTVKVVQELKIVPRLFPLVLSGAKRATIRWREPEIRPGLMRYICEDDPTKTAVVRVVKSTRMPLSAAAAFLHHARVWPPEVMLDGMREHYPDIQLDDIVQVVEHLPPAASGARTRL
jgi:hypothetical protein